MRRTLISIAALGLILASCTAGQQVKGIQVGPGEWQVKGSSTHADMTSDVQYLGASADGHVIVRLADGTTQIWGHGP